MPGAVIKPFSPAPKKTQEKRHTKVNLKKKDILKTTSRKKKYQSKLKKKTCSKPEPRDVSAELSHWSTKSSTLPWQVSGNNFSRVL